MAPRTILYTGKGGVGKTSVAAATARRAAGSGRRTLLMSTDPAHSLGDVLEAELYHEPTQVDELLWAREISARDELERHWAAVRRWLSEALVSGGVDRISAEELTVPPGMDELFSLLALRDHHDSGEFDVIVVDCAPTGETLRLLSFPEVARWWLDKVFPQQGRLLDAARPLARAVLDVTLPGDEVFEDVRRLVANLVAMNELLRDREHVSLRLVTTADRMVVDEARRTFTYLNLYGFLTDAVVVNRLFSADAGAYFGSWRERQLQQLEEIAAAFAPVPVLQAPYFEREVVGAEMLDRLAEALFAGRDPADRLHDEVSEELELTGEDAAVLRLRLPLADRGEVGLKRVGADLVVSVGRMRRTIHLPAALRDLRPADAAFEDGTLTITLTRETVEATDDR